MLRRITLTLALLALVGFGLAQTIVPTKGPGEDGIGVSPFGAPGDALTASVTQSVNLKIPAVVALHLDVTELTFDISRIGAEDSAAWACVYGPGFRDEDIDDGALGADYYGQVQTLPLGTYYTATTWPNITIVARGGSPIEVTQYPPRRFDADGELVPGSKNYFVCYRTFILQKFSTVAGWDLSVERTGGTYDMYIQDNTCSDFGNPAGTGLYKIDDGGSFRLLPQTMTGGTTGALVTGEGDYNRCEQGKSWLDDLVVVAVKVNGEAAGDNRSTLTYSLTATVPTNDTAP